MEQDTLALLSHFDTIEEVVQTLLVSNAEAEYRVELLHCHKGGRRLGYKPRVFRQETVTVSADYAHPRPREMLIWRDYEMGFVPTEDPEVALRMAVSVIREKRGR